MSRTFRRLKVKKIAVKRATYLSSFTESFPFKFNFTDDVKKAYYKRYGNLIMRILRRNRARLGSPYKYRICRKCHSYLIPSETLRVRINKGKIVYTCLKCGNIRRIGIK